MSDYEEDFEGYDEDFESDSGLEAPAAPEPEASAAYSDEFAHSALPAQPALPPQRNAAPTSNGRPTATAPAAPAVGTSVLVSPITQLSAAERSKGLKRLLQRRELLGQVALVQQEVVEVFSLGPLTPYQLLSQGKGPYSSRRDASSQKPVREQEIMDAEQQTEEVETQASSCQVPEESSTSQQRQGPSSSSNSRGAPAPGTRPNGPQGDAGSAAASRLTAQEGPIAKFLAWATPIMLQELSRTEGGGGGMAGPQLAPITGSGSSVAAGSCSLSAVPLTEGRRLVAAQWAPAAAQQRQGAASSKQQQRQQGPAQLCCAYSAVQLPPEELLKAHGLEGSSLLCVWQLGAGPAAPEYVLAMDGDVSCCCWGLPPYRHLVFAGTEEGAVCCWDLSEPDSRHPQEDNTTTTTTPARRPSYTTEAAAPSSTLTGRVVAVRCLLRASAGGAGSRASMSLLVLGAGGQLMVYGVVVLRSAAAAAAQVDAGMRVGSCMRLIANRELLPLGRLAAQPLHLRPPPRDWPPVEATCLTLLPPCSSGSGPGQQQQQQGEGVVLVGTRSGQVLKGAIGATPPAPRVLLPDLMQWPLSSLDMNAVGHATTSKPELKDCGTGGVVAMAVSPCCSEALLCAHAQGRITLHSINRARALCAWQHVAGAAPVAVRWVPERPCLFLVLDQQGGVAVYNACKPDQPPQLLEGPAGSSSSSSSALVMDVWSSSGSSSSMGRSISKGSSLQRRLAGSKGSGASKGSAAAGGAMNACWLVVGGEGGAACCYKLAPALCEEPEGEAEALQALMV